jgi:hypothetical protein
MIKAGDKVWITKYALTKGIIPGVCLLNVETRGLIAIEEYGQFVYWKLGDDVFSEFDSAVLQAEKMRDRKINSLQKQLKRVCTLTFKKQ